MEHRTWKYKPVSDLLEIRKSVSVHLLDCLFHGILYNMAWDDWTGYWLDSIVCWTRLETQGLSGKASYG